MESFYKNYIKNNFNILDKVNVLKVDKLFKNLKNIKKKNKKVLIFGNGAGASIASHFANDLTNSAKIRCLSFDSSTQLTCYANDFGYDNWVKEAIKNFFEKNKYLIH